jgi:hypothetical protein
MMSDKHGYIYEKGDAKVIVLYKIRGDECKYEICIKDQDDVASISFDNDKSLLDLQHLINMAVEDIQTKTDPTTKKFNRFAHIEVV